MLLVTLAGVGNSVFHPANYAIMNASVDEASGHLLGVERERRERNRGATVTIAADRGPIRFQMSGTLA